MILFVMQIYLIILHFVTIVGDGINKVYFTIFIPIGIAGNTLSFLVRLSSVS